MRVLLAYDHSSTSKIAVDFALQFPTRRPVDLDVVSVVEPPIVIDPTFGAIPMNFHTFVEEERMQIERDAAAICERVGGNPRINSVHRHVLIGQPSVKLLETAEQRSTDLVILGAVGHSTVERVLLGSVSDYVATHGTMSTLVVRPPSAEGASVKKIMLALSGYPEDSSILDWIREMEFGSDVEVHLVRVLDLFTFYRQDFRQKASEIWNEQSEDAKRQVHDFERELQQLNLNTESHLIQASHVGDALTNYAERHEIDLLITGASDSGLLTRVILRSVSRYVLRHAGCSVLIARTKKGEKAMDRPTPQAVATGNRKATVHS